MYRCSECGCEYKDKPDFCDCGNNIFAEISESVPEIKKLGNALKIDKLSLLSWSVFSLCLILSVLVLLFFPKIPEKVEVASNQEVIQQPKQDIPNLNSFWIDCKPSEPVGQEPVVQPVIEQIRTVFTPKQEVKQQIKPVVKQSSAGQNKQVKQTQVKQVQQSKPVQTQVKQTVQPVQQVKTSTQPVKTTYTYEVANYRTALRQRLLNNLNLYKIEGSGKCGIEFSVDENGKLVNRRFIFQSENKTVNDEVYKMLMRTPQYSPPPPSYVNKKIRMTFNLDSQSYEIKYID